MNSEKSRSEAIRRRRELTSVKIETLAQEAGCGASTIQRVERGESVKNSTLIKIEAALDRLEKASREKISLLSKREALMFGAYSASAIDLTPIGDKEQNGALDEFFEFVDKHKIIDESSFPGIHKWKRAYRTKVDIANKQNLEMWLTEVSSIHELVAKFTPELFGISLFARSCKIGAIMMATDDLAAAETEFELAKIYVKSIDSPEIIFVLDELVATKDANQALKLANLIILVLYKKFA